MAVWYLNPMGQEATQDPLPVRISGDWGLTDLHLWQVDPVARVWEDLGALTEGPDGWEGAITRLDTLALVAPTP